MMYICIDLGGTNLRGTWVDERGRVGQVIYLTRPKDLQGSKETLLSLIQEIKKNAPENPRGIGLATAGPLDHLKKCYLETSNMPELNYFKVGDFLEKSFSLPVIMENDAQAAALGEVWMGGLAGEKDAVVFTLGTGLGSGVILKGEIWRGAHFTGPELGHIYLGQKTGTYCGCGQAGCAEVNLNKAALEELFAEHGFAAKGLKEMYAQVQAGHEEAVKVMQEYGKRLGLYLSINQVIFGAKCIGFAGGISAFSPFFQDYVWEVLKTRFKKRPWWMPEKIAASPDPEMSGLFGMARAWIIKERRG